MFMAIKKYYGSFNKMKIMDAKIAYINSNTSTIILEWTH